MHRYKVFTEHDDGDYIVAEDWRIDRHGNAIFLAGGTDTVQYDKNEWFYIQQEK